MPSFTHSPLLVTGASGHFGRLVVAELLARGATDVRAGSRDPSRLPATTGARPVRVDFDDAASLDAAMAGVERVLIVSTDSLTPDGTRQRQHRAAVDAAVRAGVRHIVYTSMPAPTADHPIFFAPDHLATEQAIQGSGLPHTILRNNWYFENTLLGMPAAIAQGALYTSAGKGGLAQVARADLAAAAAGALLTETASATHDLSGPEAITMDTQVATFNAALGTDVKVVHLDDAALSGGLAAAGVPAGLAALIVGADRAIREGRMGTVTDTVARLSGRKPQKLADWLTVNRALFGR